MLLHVTGFLHYLYIAAPTNFQPSDCKGFQSWLDTQVGQYEPVIHSVEVVLREDLYGFQNNTRSPYLKITVKDHSKIARVRNLLENKAPIYKGFWKNVNVDDGVKTFDSIAYILRFMIDTRISGMSWVQAPAKKYTMIPERDRQSNCQIEAEVYWKDLISYPADGEWAKMAPLRILSFDIECAGRPGVFPEPDMDPVIQIANVVTTYGSDKPFVRNVFCLGTTSSIVNTQIFEFDQEEKMMMGWRVFLALPF